MLRINGIAILAVWLLPLRVLAQDPEGFLAEVVKADLVGDPSPRIGRVRFSTASRQAEYNEARDIGGPVPEAYALDMDPLVVVDDGKIVSQRRLSTSKVCISAEFMVLARTKGEGLPSWNRTTSREIEVLRSRQPERVEYCADRVGGQWLLVDPPIPRVRRDVVVAAIQARLSRAQKIIAEVKTSDPRAIKNMTVVRDSLARQLAALLTLSSNGAHGSGSACLAGPGARLAKMATLGGRE